MILVRVEPVLETVKFPAGIEEKKAFFLSAMPERMIDRMSRKFNEQDLGNVMGCWFMPAYEQSFKEGLDILLYANEIVKDDHDDFDLRIVAIEIPDNQVEQFHVKRSQNFYVQSRSFNVEAEYVVPTQLIIKSAQEIMRIPKGESLSEGDYLKSLAIFRAGLLQTKPEILISDRNDLI